MTKSNVPRMTLLHHLVEQAEAKQKDSLAFVDDLLDLLQKASRYVEHVVFVFSLYLINPSWYFAANMRAQSWPL